MCGVPIHAAEAYLARLIKGGHRVAIAEQVESPAEAQKRGAKSVVNRAIVRVVTAGTLTEEALLDSRAANWLVAVAAAGDRCGVAAADISTGRFELTSVAPRRSTPSWRGWRHRRSSPVLRRRPEPMEQSATAPAFAGAQMLRATQRLRQPARRARAEGALGPGRGGRVRPRGAGGRAGPAGYLDEVGRESLPFLRAPGAGGVIAPHDDRRLDARKPGADLLARAGTRAGSLLHAADRTVTGAGARLLAADIAAPLTRGRDRGAAGLVGWVERDPPCATRCAPR
jgi:DNA mismatch repair protein MutS